MKNLILATLGLLFSVNASATGGIWCEYNKDGQKFEFSAVTSHGFEAQIVDAAAELSGNINQKFVEDDLRQYWNEGGDLRLNLYAEVEGTNDIYSTTNVIVKVTTDPKDEFQMVGTISIRHTTGETEMVIKDQPITCSQE